MPCSSKDCEKFIKGQCKTPLETVTEENAAYSVDKSMCSCAVCDWSKSTEPCEWVGDPYNTGGDCLAEK